VETMCLLMAYKIKYPDTFFLLRGSHECTAMNRIVQFSIECKFFVQSLPRLTEQSSVHVAHLFQAKNITVHVCGGPSRSVSTACQWLLLWMRRYSVSMEVCSSYTFTQTTWPLYTPVPQVCHLIFTLWGRFIGL